MCVGGHVIVLFEFIEERREHGALPSGELRNPLWECLCYAQIARLSVATFIMLGTAPEL